MRKIGFLILGLLISINASEVIPIQNQISKELKEKVKLPIDKGKLPDRSLTKPDLIVIKTSASSINDFQYRDIGNNKALVTIKVKNIGFTNVTKPFKVLLKEGDKSYTKTVNKIKRGETKSITFRVNRFSFSPDASFEVIVDSKNNINEVNENNNRAVFIIIG